MTNLIIAVMGRPGVGKSTLARKLASYHDAPVFSTDAVRTAALDAPRYGVCENRAVYEAVFQMVKWTLRGRRDTVVVDGTFSDGANRMRLEEAARLADAEVQWYLVVCDSEEAKRRIAEREGPSDATPSLYDSMDFDAVERDVTVVDTTEW